MYIIRIIGVTLEKRYVYLSYPSLSNFFFKRPALGVEWNHQTNQLKDVMQKFLQTFGKLSLETGHY